MGSTTILRVDYTADVNQLTKSALDILKSLRPAWKEEEVKFMNFTEGITNKLIGCYRTSDTRKEDGIVMRVYGEKTELIIDREREMANMQILHAAGCAAPVYARFNNGIAYGFVPGICLDNNVRTPEIYKCVTRSMAAMHQVDPEKLGLHDEAGNPVTMDRTPCLFTKLRRYIKLAPESFPEKERDEKLKQNFPTKEVLNAECDRMEAALTKLGSPSVFCHNDLLLKNIVYNKEKGTAMFIDYEYGAFNFEAFDVGNHFAEWSGVDEVDFTLYPSREEQLPWIRCYLEHKAELSGQGGDVTDRDIERLYVQANQFALMGHFFWGVWGLIQAEVSIIDFDYLGYAKLKLDEYFNKRDEFLALQMPA